MNALPSRVALSSLLLVPSLFAAEFIPLGDLPGGMFFSRFYSVSADGTTVVGESQSASGLEAVRWRADTGLVSLGELPGGPVSGGAVAVSADGSVVVGSSLTTLGREVFRWTAADGLVNLGDLPGGTVSGFGTGITPDGDIIVGTGNSELGSEGYRWTAATGMVPLGAISGGRVRSSAQRVSDDGSVIVGAITLPGSQEAYRWTEAGGFEVLGELPGGPVFGVALAVSPEGAAVAGWSYTGPNLSTDIEAMLWTRERGLIGLGTAPGTETSVAWGVTGSGFIVAGSGGFLEDPGWVWDAHQGMRLIQDVAAPHVGAALAGWQIEAVRGVRHTGSVFSFVGHGLNPDGHREGWLLRLTPQELGLEPARLAEDLLAELDQLVTHGGTAQSLAARLAAFIDLLDDGQPANDPAAAALLESFIRTVERERGDRIEEEAAVTLIAAATNLLALLE
ncbi:MAG: PEP-CTERM sorting domain-containing protein [Verrucomicrobiales bacterium]|nr:PEP-CTERM sorting domain-containing protein [Verrucomicrobiales bacterium]